MGPPKVISSLAAVFLVLSAVLFRPLDAVRCLDCVGRNCMGNFCEGDYCVLAHYAPRWGTAEWGGPRMVKGCMSGKMLRNDIRSHCETADDEGEEVFTCFCDTKNCNGDRAVRKLEMQPVPLLTCVCDGPHCHSADTCLGELCSYVINHKTKETEQGCVNASVPLIERRSQGSCMVPPITGAMHHSVAKSAEDLLFTESCVCGTDYCNSEKPKITAKENMKCDTFAMFDLIGSTMASKNSSCSGEYCFKANIKSKLGHMTSYQTMGCASFVEGAELAEEMEPTGCAKFESENVEVEACFKTDDKRAIGRARANQEMTTPRRKQSKSKSKTRQKPKMEVTYDEEEAEEEDEEPVPKPARTSKQRSRQKEDEAEKSKEAEEEAEEEEEEEEKEKESEGEASTAHYIFERPTMAPIPEEDSNLAMISVFLLLIVLIALSGLVWKLELHKKLFRSSYDTVAGG